jgi:UDP-galactopyranose mutase
MNTFHELWGVKYPHEAKEIIERQRFKGTPTNLEEQALSLVGKDVYETLIKGYTEKQWGKSANELPSSIIKRIPVRFTFNNNYFSDRYQGIPIGGYTKMFEKLLEGITVWLNADYFSSRIYFDNLAKKVVYTGCIDEFFDYEFGELDYRSLTFIEQIVEYDNWQGNAVVNYCDKSFRNTRVIEHKHFENTIADKTVITHEYPEKYFRGMIPYYPINDDCNQKIYEKYKEKSKTLTNFIFGGRLSEYKYMDMNVVIESVFNKFKNE